MARFCDAEFDGIIDPGGGDDLFIFTSQEINEICNNYVAIECERRTTNTSNFFRERNSGAFSSMRNSMSCM